MTLVRTFVFSLIACALLFSQSVQARASSPFPGLPPQAGQALTVALDEDDRDDDEHAAVGQNRGVLQGDIAGVDYAQGILHLQTARHGRVDVQILPSTNIVRRGDQYGTIADLAPGVRVSVNVSQVGGRLTAQIIRIH
ncbi:MAG: hypothetical protein NVSMB31_00930 [Vulcanimicrobiaceae bacterium]